jgi:hypothetical protein
VPDLGSGANLGMVTTRIPPPGSLPVPYPRSPEPAHPGHPGGPGDYRGQLPPGSRGVTVHDPDHPLPHTTARCPLCREVPGLPARHAGRPGRVFPAAARRGWLPSRNMRKSPCQTNAGNLTREDARINAEIRCYAEFQAPDSCTRLPRCTDLPRYLELRFGHMRIISSIYVRLGMWRYAIRLMPP